MRQQQQQQDWSGIWVLVGFVLFVAYCASLFSSNSTQSLPNNLSTPPASSSPERRYVENRFRLEGYSQAESRQAADAVMKFHQAQQNRR
jgi:hypothetical protein